MEIYEIIITAAPCLTAIITTICAVISGIKKFAKVDGTLVSLRETNATIIKENQELKRELKKVYKMHSEIVEHIYYKHPEDCDCEVCNGSKKN